MQKKQDTVDPNVVKNEQEILEYDKEAIYQGISSRDSWK